MNIKDKERECMVNGKSRMKVYDEAFEVTDSYLDSLPDTQETLTESTLMGKAIPHVGISGFRLPIHIAMKDGGGRELDAKVDGGVTIEKHVRGAHMSRLARIFYQHRVDVFRLESIEPIIREQESKLGTKGGRLKLSFRYPIKQKSLRSELEGHQYYPVSYEGRIGADGVFRKFIRFEYTYSSACPCSSALSEHAREWRNQYGVPHSQRSKAFLSVEVAEEATLWIDDLQEMCLSALKTEVQVMVKREDEQAFAELNGAHLKFVEDAARLLYRELDNDIRIKDFRVKCQHYESLHPYDVEAIICKGVTGGFGAEI